MEEEEDLLKALAGTFNAHEVAKAIRSKDAEIERLRRLAYGVEVIDVEAGVTRIVVEEAGVEAGASPRMRKEQAASARVIGALQERLVEVKKEHVEERAVRHSELRASVDAKVKEAVKEACAKVAEALAVLVKSFVRNFLC